MKMEPSSPALLSNKLSSSEGWYHDTPSFDKKTINLTGN
jgi:hypothetical protein